MQCSKRSPGTADSIDHPNSSICDFSYRIRRFTWFLYVVAVKKTTVSWIWKKQTSAYIWGRASCIIVHGNYTRKKKVNLFWTEVNKIFNSHLNFLFINDINLQVMLKELTFTHKKQNMCPQGSLLGWTQICRHIGHSIISRFSPTVSNKNKRSYTILNCWLSTLRHFGINPKCINYCKTLWFRYLNKGSARKIPVVPAATASSLKSTIASAICLWK